MSNLPNPPLAFTEWCLEVDIEARYQALHDEYGDACCLLSEYKYEHYMAYLKRYEVAPKGAYVSAWE